MALSSIEETLIANKQTFTLAFAGPSPGYISRDHVKLYINGNPGIDVGATFEFTTASTITILGYTTLIGDVVLIRRETPFTTPLVDFVGGGQFTELDLDTAFLQTLYIEQERIDGYNDTAAQTPLDMGNQKIVNLAAPTNLLDATNKQYSDEQDDLLQAILEAQISALALSPTARGHGIRSVTVDSIITTADEIIMANATSGNIVLTMPTAGSMYTTGSTLKITVKRTNLTGGIVTVNGVSGVPGGLVNLTGPLDYVELVSDGTDIHYVGA